MRVRRLLGLTVALSAAAVPASAATGGDSVFGAVTSRVTVNAAGEESRSVFVASRPAVSRDGRFVVFDAGARDLVPGGDPRFGGVYVRDRLAGRTFVASVSNEGQVPTTPHGTYGVAISATGRYVAFADTAPNLVRGDTNDTPDVFVRDTVGRHTERVSVTSAGRQVNGYSERPGLSADGRYVVFQSGAAIVGDDRNDNLDAYVHDRVTGATVLVSRSSAGVAANGWSELPAISGDGRWVAFSSTATNLGGSRAGVPNLYLRDLVNDRTLAVTTFTRGFAEGFLFSPTVSHDGRFVAYTTSLTPAGRDRRINQVYRWDRLTDRVVLVSQARNHEPANAASLQPSISYDGNRIAFYSSATNLVASVPSTNEVYVRDVTAGTTKIASVTPDGAPANGGEDANVEGSVDGVISGDGRHVVFRTGATNLLDRPERYNSGPDVFARDTAVG